MGTVTGIVRASGSHGTSRVELHVDGEHWATCSDAVIAEFRLYSGKELDSAELAGIQRRVVETDLLAACHVAVSQRQLTSHQLRERLMVRGHSAEMVDVAIARAAELGLVDDAEYACLFVRSRLNRGQGGRRIRADLVRRGVAREHIDAAMEAVADPGSVGGACARALLRKFAADDLAEQAVEARARQFLLRRGFDYADVDRAVRLARDPEALLELQSAPA